MDDAVLVGRGNQRAGDTAELLAHGRTADSTARALCTPSRRCLSPVCEEQTAMSFPGSLVRRTVPTFVGDNAREEKKHGKEADDSRSHDSDPLRGSFGVTGRRGTVERSRE